MIKKDKVFELKIEDDDEVSGIDSISLVDEPAIEVNWVSFNKQTIETPDGFWVEFGKAEPIQINGTDMFEHGEDSNNYSDLENGVQPTYLTKQGIKYAENAGKYVHEHNKTHVISSEIQRAHTTAKIMTDKANELHDKKFVKHETSPLLNTLNIGKYDGRKRGSFDEEYWLRHKDSKIPNGESMRDFMDRMEKCYKFIEESPESHQMISHSKVIRAVKALHETGGKWNDETSDKYLKYRKSIPIPDDMAEPTTGSTKPATSSPVPPAKPKVSVDYDGVLATDEGKQLIKTLLADGDDVYVVTQLSPEEGEPVLEAAQSVDIPKQKVIFTDGEPKSKFLNDLGIVKHYDNNPEVLSEIKKNAPTVDGVDFDYNVGTIGGYVDPGITRKKKKKGKIVSPAEISGPPADFTKQYFQTDDEKQMVLGPAMIPNMKIFRKDNNGQPYYVFFSAETIAQIALKYMKNKYTDNNDENHDGKPLPDVFVVESWIKENMEFDKGNAYGFSDLPIGTWFVSIKINNPDVWAKIKDHQLNGFSVSGYFEEVQAFTKEEMFLYKVVEILNKTGNSQ